MSKLTRNCPECDKGLEYKSVSARNLAERKGSLCGSCARSGERNNMYGKTHTEEVRMKQSKMMRENNPLYRKDVREKISKAFKGINNPKVKKYIKENNLTPEQYEKQLTDFYKYRLQVESITKQQPIHILKNYDKPRGKMGVRGAYQLDHIVSVHQGFHQDISAEIIGNISNLQFISWDENRDKWFRRALEV